MRPQWQAGPPARAIRPESGQVCQCPSVALLSDGSFNFAGLAVPSGPSQCRWLCSPTAGPPARAGPGQLNAATAGWTPSPSLFLPSSSSLVWPSSYPEAWRPARPLVAASEQRPAPDQSI